jgi:hypothetical protein
MATVLSNSALIFPLEIAKFAFFIVYIAATIGVVVGVYLEGDQFDKKTQQRGWRILLRSLAIDTLFTILIFGTDGWIGSIQRSEIIGLQKRLAARSLTDEQKMSIASRLKQFPPQTIQIIPYWQNKESLDIANAIAETLQKDGWTIHNPERYTALIGVIAGVYISVDKRASEAAKGAAKELARALNDNDVLTTEEEGENGPPNDPLTEQISMQVGIKP